MKAIPPGMDGIPLAGKLGHDCSYCESHRKQQYFLRCPNCGRLLHGLENKMKAISEKLADEIHDAVSEVLSRHPNETPTHDARTWTFYHPNDGQRIFNADQMAAEIQRLYGDLCLQVNIEDTWPDQGMEYTFEFRGDVFTYESVVEMSEHIKRLLANIDESNAHAKRVFAANEEMGEYLTRIKMMVNDPNLRIAT